MTRSRSHLTVTELCDELGVARSTFYDWRAKGRAPTADTQLARVLSTTCDNAIGRLALEIFGPQSREYASFADTNFRLAMTAGVAVGAFLIFRRTGRADEEEG